MRLGQTILAAYDSRLEHQSLQPDVDNHSSSAPDPA
jgi:hypothetical protein